jgi:hypothetical protein
MGHSDDRSNSQERGRTALDLEHESISAEDERRIDTRICIMYGVEVDEARDIHTNYHSHRLYLLLRDRARKHGMPESTFLERLKGLNVYHYAQIVSQGRLMEMAAVDVLYKGLYMSDYDPDDRYISFYG